MAHYGSDLQVRKATPNNWLRVGATVGSLVNTWAGRDDLVVNLSERNSADAPALFTPSTAEIEVNTSAFGAGVEPEQIGDFQVRRTQLAYPVASGAIFHEALHARYTQWDLAHAVATLHPDVVSALHLLEEGRIEAWGVRNMPKNRLFLRSSAMSIVLGDLTEEDYKNINLKTGARLAGLILARVDAGVLEEDDVDSILDIIDSVIPADVLEQLREIWTTYQNHSEHSNPYPLYVLAQDWVTVLKNATEAEQGEEGEGEGEGESQDGSGEGEGAGKGKGEGSTLSEALAEALNDIKDLIQIVNQQELDDAEQSENDAEIVRERSEKGKERGVNRKISQEVFGKGTGPSEDNGSNSRLRESRLPTPNERVAAIQIAKALEKAKYSERSQTEVNSIIPPGRLRTGAMVQAAAMKSKGLRSEIAPWRTTQRKQTDSPELKIGVMVDISGSMGSAMQPMAVTAWAISEATRRVDGKCAMVYYGSGVFSTLKPGQHLKEVKVYTAPDGTEKFDKGFRALDGSLSLLHGSGARLLVVVSDGFYTSEERENARNWVRRCYESGVAVLWLTYDTDVRSVNRIVKDNGTVLHLDPASKTSDTTLEIGKAAVNAINKVTAKVA